VSLYSRTVVCCSSQGLVGMLPSDEARAGKCRQMQSWPVILEMLTLKNSLENVSITGLCMDTSHG
jgi:hypothetical protein